jgi:hypothetical protein
MNRFTNADECEFFSPASSYPYDLSQSTAAYFSQPNDTTVTLLQNDIAQHAKLLNNISHSDSALKIQTTSNGSS